MARLQTRLIFTDDQNKAEVINGTLVVGGTATIDDAQMVTVNLGSEIKNNNMTVKISNNPVNFFPDGTVQHRWVNDDKTAKFKAIKAKAGDVINEEIIDLYSVYDSINATGEIESNQNFIFSGIITKGKIKWSSQEHSIELNCKDRSVIMLDKLTKPIPIDEDDALAAPAIIQNLVRHATLNYIENATGFNSTGSDALGGQYLIDARLFSESIVDSGTADGTTTNKLIESGQNFTSTVSAGDWVRNTTDETYAYVNSVDSDTQLTLSKDIIVSGEGYEISNGFIQDTRPDGTSFPTITFYKVDKPVTEGISDLSQIEQTNNGTETDPDTGALVVKRGARWFVDSNNRFHWYIPDDTPEHYFKVGQTSAVSPDTVHHIIHEVNLTHETDDNINFIIFKAGEDMDGVQIKSYNRAAFSGAPIVKDSFRDWSHISRELKNREAQAGTISKDDSDKYNYPGSYPATPHWTSGTAANDSEYNTLFRTEAINRGKAKAHAIFQQRANPRWKGSIIIRGENIIVGDLLDFTSDAHGIQNAKLRVKGVSHTIIPNSGWITSIEIEEDELEAEKAVS